MQGAAYPIVPPGPPRPGRVLRPGETPRGTERHRVAGAGALLLALSTGDRITLTDAEGGQPCEVLACGTDGRVDAGVIGERGSATATGLQALLTGQGSGMARLRAGLVRRGIDAGAPGAIRLFGTTSPAGSHADFAATRDGWLVVAAPGPSMDPGAQDTATPILIHVHRAQPRAAGVSPLPDPLADPTLDLRIPSATAASYRVNAGDYIQIIDVDGRQCTDFQCFDARKLDRGLDRPLDVTTSRTLMGHDWSRPGLHSKYYDHDLTPLVEVVQDTVGRHDAFAMACAAKYYDDIGYPGHANCSDNFNAALAPHGVTPRPGWMAVNLFFNTAIDAHGVMVTDEPWSRPGDHVLFRALTDLVCVSSACPDDTTPANGWTLTDIHVRTYPGAARFTRGSAWRPTPDAEPQMTRDSAFHPRTSALTGDLVDYKGFWLPNSYPAHGTLAEYRACREGVAVIDLSVLRKWEVTGPDAEALLNHALTRDVSKLAVGQVVYSAMCHPHGGMIDDGTLFRLGLDQFRWIGGDDFGGVWLREQAAALGLTALVRGSTDQLHNIAVQGPDSRDLLAGVIWTAPHQTPLRDLGWFRFTVGRIGGPQGAPVVVSRTGYTGELGYEVFCHPKDGLTVWDAVWEAGQPRGLVPMGLAALDMLRIEAGLIFAGNDFNDQTDPFEAGIGFTVPLKSKIVDFVGRDALIRRKEHPRNRFVGLQIDGATGVHHGDPVFAGRAQVGVVTSATRSPILGKTVALARIDVACADAGTTLEVGKLDGLQKRLPAVVTAPSHYDPGKTRPQS